MARFCVWIVLGLFTFLPRAFSQEAPLRLGLIGLDTSHVIAFTSRFNDSNNPNHVPGGRVVAAYKGGSPDLPDSWDRVDGYTETLVQDYGVILYDDIPSLCAQVDAVLLTSLDGRPHLEQARPVIAAGLPLFVDKPVAGSLRDAVEIFRLAEEAGTPCFTSSSLRWYPGVVDVATADIGPIHGAISYGPSPVEPHHPKLFWYGIHPTEALFTVLGAECQSVVCSETESAIVVTGQWSGGRVGTMHGIVRGRRAYQVTALGENGIAEQSRGGDYTPMLREIIRFFRTGIPPVAPEESLRIYAFMEAAEESAASGGERVFLRDILDRAGYPQE